MDYNEVIKKSGLKKGWIAEKLGIGRVSLSHYINGTRPMPDEIKIGLNRILFVGGKPMEEVLSESLTNYYKRKESRNNT